MKRIGEYMGMPLYVDEELEGKTLEFRDAHTGEILARFSFNEPESTERALSQ